MRQSRRSLHAWQLFTRHPDQSAGDHADRRQRVTQFVGHQREDVPLLRKAVFGRGLQVLCTEDGQYQLFVGFAHLEVTLLLIG